MNRVEGVGNDFVGIAHGGYLENLKSVHEGHEIPESKQSDIRVSSCSSWINILL
jgi:hypothetical protein